MFAFYIMLEIFEEKNRRKWYSYFMPPKKDDDLELEVIQEKKRVEEYMKRKKDNIRIKIICIYIML